MRTERITIYIAEDGRRFSKEGECREYEKRIEKKEEMRMKLQK